MLINYLDWSYLNIAIFIFYMVCNKYLQSKSYLRKYKSVHKQKMHNFLKVYTGLAQIVKNKFVIFLKKVFNRNQSE